MSDSLWPHESQHARPSVHHQLPEFTETHIHRVSDAIQPSHPLSSPSPPAPNPSQHQNLFQWVNSSHEVAKVLEFSALASFLPKKSQGWSPSEWTGWISLPEYHLGTPKEIIWVFKDGWYRLEIFIFWSKVLKRTNFRLTLNQAYFTEELFKWERNRKQIYRDPFSQTRYSSVEAPNTDCLKSTLVFKLSLTVMKIKNENF